VEGDAEVGEVALVARLDDRDVGLRRHPGLLGGEHDRGAMGVVGADEVRRVARQPLRAGEDVPLDVADQVAQVQRAVGVGQGAGDDELAGHGVGAAGEAVDYRMRPRAIQRPMEDEPNRNGPPGAGRPGSRESGTRGYLRTQVWVLPSREKPMKPRTSSLAPPSTGRIFTE